MNAFDEHGAHLQDGSLRAIDRENLVLTFVVAAMMSVAVVLATYRITPVFMFACGLAVFCLILLVGWQAAGAKTGLWAAVASSGCLWIWCALLFWFAYVSGQFWIWIFGAALIFGWVSDLLFDHKG